MKDFFLKVLCCSEKKTSLIYSHAAKKVKGRGPGGPDFFLFAKNLPTAAVSDQNNIISGYDNNKSFLLSRPLGKQEFPS